MNIAVFDSGRGGYFVAERLKSLLPDHQYAVFDDVKNVPYGSKTTAEVINLTESAIKPLIDNYPIIVIACNTATALAIDHLRSSYPLTHFIGYEPMVKTVAELSENRHGTILATEATRQSLRYKNLRQQLEHTVIIDEPDTTDWATLIENDQSENIALEPIQTSVKSGSDVIALACTHYLAIEDKLKKLFPTVKIIEPTPAVAHRITMIVDLLQK